MRRIVKDAAPAFWLTYVKRHPKDCYRQLDSTVEGRSARNQLRDHLVEQQKMICCYCCGSLEKGPSSAHNEHVKPQSSYPNDSMDYGNLLASCNNGNTCGAAKCDTYDDRYFVSPLREDCEDHFSFSQDGRIRGVTEEGKRTIEVLNLNHRPLVERRKAQFENCLRMAQCMGKEWVQREYIQLKGGVLSQYADMAAYFYRQGMFDKEVCG